ncbi:Ankyrin_repeat-containing protein [Hexamita inflata]|uniref:Ankyrin_repeat-containing protein n=1 Tax=Hexamita inflata TaxID=28002 RepID=A0ABP1H1Y3_9EUKA
MLSPSRQPQQRRSYSGCPTQIQSRASTRAQTSQTFNPLRPLISDEFGETELIKCLRKNNKTLFQKLYFEQAEQSQVTQFMFNAYIYGQNWNAQLKIPSQASQSDSSGKTLLHYAAGGNINLQEGYFKGILDKFGGQVDARGCSALMIAAVHGNIRAVQTLLKIECGIQDINGCTALMCAAKMMQKPIIDALLPYEATCQDKNGFIFVDYLPKNVDDAYMQHLHTAMKKFFKEYKAADIQVPVIPKELPPDFIALKNERMDDMKTLEKGILERIEISKQYLQRIKSQPLENFKTDCTEYLKIIVFKDFNKTYTDYKNTVDKELNIEDELESQLAQKLLTKAKNNIESLQNVYQCKENVMHRFTPNQEKIHLQVLYSSNDLNQQFEKIFNELEQVLYQHQQQIIECMTTYNKITYLDLDYARQRVDVQDHAAQYMQANSTQLKSLQSAYKQMLENIHSSIDQEIELFLNEQLKTFYDQTKPEYEFLMLRINEKMVRRISQSAIQTIHQIIHAKQMLTSFPTVEQFRTNVNCLVYTFKQKCQSNLFYERFTGLYSFAHSYLDDLTGLFAFISEENLLPLRRNFSTFQSADEYFRQFDSQFKFTGQQLKIGIVNALKQKWNQQVEEKLVKHMQEYYRRKNMNQIPELLAPRLGALAKSKLHVLDLSTIDIELCFSYFYISLIGIVNKAELIEYKQTLGVSGLKLNQSEDYKGTTRQSFLNKTFYSCRSPGWMYLENGVPIIIMEPIWEEES